MLGGQLVHRAGVWPPSAGRQRVAELVDAADYSPDRSGGVRPPTSRRITGSRQRRSASLTSSHPARREKTDWRRNPAGRWRPFRPVRGSASDSAAMFVSPRASSSSRWNSRPPSELMEDPPENKLHRAVELEPQRAGFHLTRRVRRQIPAPLLLTHCEINLVTALSVAKPVVIWGMRVKLTLLRPTSTPR